MGQLEGRGLVRCHHESEADLLLFNTCSVRDLPERKAMSKLGLLSGTQAIIGVTGCMANAKKELLLKKFPHIDFVLGTNNIHELNYVLDEVLATDKQMIRADEQFTCELNYLVAKREDKIKAQVSIIRGCDQFCSYCIVPHTRGSEVSRTPESIVEECRHLVYEGYKEITLLGQNVNSYGKDHPEWNCQFHDLLYQINQISGIERLRFMTSHPADMTKEMMESFRDLKSLCEYIHLPLQSGSNRILKKMHRNHTIEQYLEKVNMLREIVPNISLGTDLMVGFANETEEEFQETFRLLKEIEYSVVYLYAYSPRKFTPAISWRDNVPEEVKQDRLQRLLSLQQDIVIKNQQTFLGQTMEVLVEKRNLKDNRFLKGKTRGLKNVLFAGGDELIGTLQSVMIHSYSHQTLLGKLQD